MFRSVNLTDDRAEFIDRMSFCGFGGAGSGSAHDLVILREAHQGQRRRADRRRHVVSAPTRNTEDEKKAIKDRSSQWNPGEVNEQKVRFGSSFQNEPYAPAHM